jgi:NADPH:quinone reductase-like Zn-dependent oxidoreductase
VQAGPASVPDDTEWIEAITMRSPDTATVVEYDQPGDADVLSLRSSPLKQPAAGEVTVKVITSSINHIEAFIRSGQEAAWQNEPFPRSSGSDFAGIVVASSDPSFSRGTEVVGHVRSGAHATYVTVPAGALVKKPRTLEWEMAGGLYLSGVTALDILDELRIDESDTVVISAAAGAVGSIESQIARFRGARVIGTCGDRNFDYLRQIGIAPVKYGPGIADRIRTAAKGQAVTAFIDNFGQDGQELATELGVPASKYRSSADRRDTELKLLADDADSVAHGTKQLTTVVSLAASRAFSLLVSGFYPLDDIVLAYADLQKLHSRGKIVLGTDPVSTYRSVKARDVHEGLA